LKINDVKDLLEKWYPLDLVEDWDISGLQIKPKKDDISNIVVGLTLNNDIIDIAIEKKSNLIICHHPIFFNEADKNDLLNIKSQNLSKLLTNKGIGFYALHTNFDKKQMSNSLAKILELSNLRVLDNQSSLGLIGDLPKKYSYKDILLKIFNILKINCMKYSDVDLDKNIERIAICSGSGRTFLDIAIESSDLYMTGDLNYHSFEKAVYFNFPLIDINHYNSEIIGVESLYEQMKNSFEIPIFFYKGRDFHKSFLKL